MGAHVAGDDHLLVVIVQRIEGVEERLLGRVLALQELDVVDQQDVDLAIARLEHRRAVVGDRVDEVVRELLGAHVSNPDAGVEALGVVADGVQEVGLAEPGVAVDEERVVRLGRRLGHGDRRRVGEAVGAADDEVVEVVLRVQAGVGSATADVLIDGGGALVGSVYGLLELDRRLGGLRVTAGWISGLTTIAKLVTSGSSSIVRERIEQGNADALLEHAAGEFVGHLEVEGAGHNALRLDQVDEAVQLRSDAVVGAELGENGRPEIPSRVRCCVGHDPFRHRLGCAQGYPPESGA